MKLMQLLLPAALLLLSSHAFAGEFRIAPVTINEAHSWAEGNLIAARFSESDLERIGCAVGNGVEHYAYCEAKDAEGLVAACLTDDPAMIETIASINTFSYVYFAWEGDIWIGRPQPMPKCEHVTIATRSIHIPAKLKPSGPISEE